MRKNPKYTKSSLSVGVVYSAKSIHGEQMRLVLKIESEVVTYLNELLQEKQTTIAKFNGWVFGETFPCPQRTIMENARQAERQVH